MALPKPSDKRAGRVVRKRLSDGTIKVYRYGAWIGAAKPPGDTMRALVQAYEESPGFRRLAATTQRTYRIYLRPWLLVGNAVPSKVTRREILAARDAIAETRGPAAANAFGRISAALFDWAAENGWIAQSPAHRIKSLPGGSLPAWDERTIATALAGLPEHLRRVVVLALHTGQRRGDLCAMTWAAYDGRSLRLRQAKTGRALTIPAHPDLARELDAWRAERLDAVQILQSPRTGAWQPTHLSHELPRALAKLGIRAGFNVHGLRKAAARRLAEAGCTVSEIAAITGHKSLSMVQLYTASADQERLAGAAVVKLTTNLQPAKKRRKT